LTSATSLSARYRGLTVLGVGAHPDDLEVAMGGTLARLAQSGARVVMTVASVPNRYETRLKEARTAAELLGCELRFLLERSQRIEDVPHSEICARIATLVQELAPAALFSHAPSEIHFDHVAVHDACRAAEGDTSFDFFTFHPLRQRMQDPVQPRVFVDVSETIEQKMRAIDAHASQFGDRGVALDRFREHARLNGRLIGVDYAEAFDVSRLLL
jgi:LmbE family N-acetylglucosaminyl deacetylase